MGDDHKHWLRAKFFQQYQLFFRYHAPSQLIVFAWVNDEDCKRAYGSSDDAYRVFRKCLRAAWLEPKAHTCWLIMAASLSSSVGDRFPPWASLRYWPSW